MNFAGPFLSFDAGRYPYSVAIGDLNGDGTLDLAVANLGGRCYYGQPDYQGAGSVSVLLGSGNGTFGGPANYQVGECASWIATGDLNGDGKLDLVTANTSTALGSGTVSVLLGNGDGTFAAKRDYGVGSLPNSVAIGDLNGDGKPDLAVTNYESLTVSVLLGIGDGTFALKIDYYTGGYVYSISMGDLNGDGNLDAVLAGSRVAVLLGNGDGTLGNRYDLDASGSGVAIGDVNGDQRPDLAVANFSYPSAVSVLLGFGDGTFGPKTEFATGFDPFSVAIGDLDADGKPDLAVANRSSNTVSVLHGNGDGTFGSKTDFVSGTEPTGLAIGDLNEDGHLDLAVTEPHAYGVGVYLGNGDGTFGTNRAFETGGGPFSVAARDLNGDGRPDLAVASNWASTASVLMGNGDGTFRPRVDFATGDEPKWVAIGDLNRDGRPDLAVANTSSNSISVLLGNGDGTFETRTDFVAGRFPISVAIGNLDGDDWPDLAVLNEYLSVFRGNGDGTFSLVANYAYGSYIPEALAVADLNGDGKLDLAVAEGAYFVGNYVSVRLGNGDGTFGPLREFRLGGLGTGYDVATGIAIGDLNGDAIPDLAIAIADNWETDHPDRERGVVTAALGNGDGTFGPSETFGTSVTPASVAIGDLNGDGKPDLAVANNSASSVSVLLGNGDGTFGPKTDFGTGNAPLSVAIGDVNGDGSGDLMVANSRGGTVTVLLNLGPRDPTATLLTLFGTGWTRDGIEVRWRFGATAGVIDSRLERGPSASGPWSVVNGERHDEGETTVMLDRDVETGRSYYYRLVTALNDGTVLRLGPFAALAGPEAQEFALSVVGPSPSRGEVRLAFTVPRPGHVRLSVLDVQGRVIAVPVDGEYPSGRAEITWDGRGERGRIPAGLYFVRYETGRRNAVGRLVLAP